MRIEEKAAYPRPDFIRENTLLLDGKWQFAFDDDGAVFRRLKAGESLPLPMEITVPFPYQSPASGIGDPAEHERVCYQRRFTAGAVRGQAALLHFGAVDHDAQVWLNGRFLGSHSGGYTPFCMEVSDLLREGENELTVYVTDEFRPDSVRGKQVWGGAPWGCHYTAVTGIWQSVWLEFTGADYITEAVYETNFDSHSVTAEVTFCRAVRGTLTAAVTRGGEEIMTLRRSVNGRAAKLLIDFEDCGVKDKEVYTWSPAHPNLFDVSLCLETGCSADTAETYFGVRKISTEKDRFYLNNSQFYSRMVLDQGYWSEGICRPQNDDGFREDVEWTLRLGFNGARKHQKIEDPKYYYWADRLGLMVWGELPSFYGFTQAACADAENTMREFIRRDRNHPCIAVWVLFNESWGLRCLPGDRRQADFARELYYLCRRIDPSRPVSTNDGWENVFPTDVAGIHDYRKFDRGLAAYYADRSVLDSGAGRTGHAFVNPGETGAPCPVLLTEFGGKRAAEAETYLAEVGAEVENVLAVPVFCGYCFTQLTDVYQETNGLLKMDRTPKADPERFREIFEKKDKQ